LAINYRALARQDALRQGLNPAIFLAQINQESGFNPNARSGAGALGIAQFMPGTAAGYHINPMNPVQALAAAALMDKQNLQKYGSVQAMLSAYNSGNPNAYRDPGFAGGQTYNYVRNILAAAKQPQNFDPGFAGNAPGSPSQGTGAASLAQALASGSVPTSAPGLDPLSMLMGIFQQNQNLGRQQVSGFTPFKVGNGY
jgi:hypothetical protein